MDLHKGVETAGRKLLGLLSCACAEHGHLWMKKIQQVCYWVLGGKIVWNAQCKLLAPSVYFPPGVPNTDIFGRKVETQVALGTEDGGV